MAERFASFDCLKWFAILSVVVGHFVDLFTSGSANYRSIFIFIYAFHMPLFVFLSGLFDHRREKFPLDSVLYYLCVGLLLKILLSVEKGIITGTLSFHLFLELDIPWFMFSLAIWKAAVWVLKEVRPALVLSLSLATALLIGYDNQCSDFLCVSRTMVFFPYYYIGFVLSPEKVNSTLSKRWCSFFGAGVLALFAFICFTQIDLVYQLRGLFTGRNPYAQVGIEDCGWHYRLLCYLISSLLCLSLISLFTRVKNPIVASWGRRTLAVYFWHWPIALLLIGAHVPDSLLGHWPGGYVWLLIAVCVTVLCSSKFLERPLSYLKSMMVGGKSFN